MLRRSQANPVPSVDWSVSERMQPATCHVCQLLRGKSSQASRDFLEEVIFWTPGHRRVQPPYIEIFREFAKLFKEVRRGLYGRRWPVSTGALETGDKRNA